MAVNPHLVPDLPVEINGSVDRNGQESLKVLLVIESAGGGSGRHIVDLATGLALSGHRVTVVYSPLRAEPGFVAALKKVDGIECRRIAMHRSAGWRDVQAVIDIRRFIRRHGPFDIAHAHSSKAGGLLRLAIIGIDIPCVYTPHSLVTLDSQLSKLSRMFFATTERLLSPVADRIICVSTDEAEHAAGLGLPDEKLRVVHNGIRPLQAVDRQRLRYQLGIGDNEVCLGTVGRLSAAKAIDRLISAFGMLHQPLPQLRVLIVGEGPERDSLEALARSLGVFDRTTFVGHADGPLLMAAMDIFALTSRFEGFPYVLVEAAARGLPIVMTNVGGSSEIVAEGANGFVVPQGHIEQLARRISDLCISPERRQRMGERSKKMAGPYGLKPMLEKTLEIYGEAIDVCAGHADDQ